jgi:cytochrome c5
MPARNSEFPRSATAVGFFCLILVCVAFATPLKMCAQASAGTQAEPKLKVDLPEGDGQAIATEYCQDCHRLTNLTKAHKARDEWQETIQEMVDRGARIPPDKVPTLIEYLVKNFGLDYAEPALAAAPAAAPARATPPQTVSSAATASQSSQPEVMLPDGDGKQVATEYCQDCHRLTNLTKAHKSRDDWQDTVQTMMDRGARIPQDKVDTLVQYLAKNFGAETETPKTPATSCTPANH